jgi:hypothetical protein
MSTSTDEKTSSPWNNKEDNSVTAFSLTMTTIAWLVVGLRLYGRKKLDTFGADDWAAIPATVSSLWWWCFFSPTVYGSNEENSSW